MARPFSESTAVHEDRRGESGTTPGTLPTTAAGRRVDDAQVPPTGPAMNQPSSPNRLIRRLARFAIVAGARRRRTAGARRDPHRRHPLDDRPGGVARHSRGAGDQALAGRDRGREGALHDPQRRQRHDHGDQERAAPDQRGQGRPHHRRVGDADLARRRRDRRQRAGAGDLARRRRRDRAAAGRAAQVGVQALADRADLDRARARSPAEERQGQVGRDDRHHDELRRRLPEVVRGDRGAARLQGRRRPRSTTRPIRASPRRC